MKKVKGGAMFEREWTIPTERDHPRIPTVLPIIIFVGVWWYCAMNYGSIGIALGCIPAVILGVLSVVVIGPFIE